MNLEYILIRYIYIWYILEQWIVVFARSDWLLKLGIYGVIHFGEALKSRRLRAKGLPGLLQ